MLLSLLSMSVTPAATVTLEVVDASGQPVPTAEVRWADEGIEIHRVHAETGRWRSSELYTPGGHAIPFRRGETYAVQVYAPGHALVHTQVQPGHDAVVVTLQPLELQGVDAGETGALAAHEAWRHAVLRRYETPFPADADARIDASRVAATQAAATWVLSARGTQDEPLARQLCVMAAYHPVQCPR